MTGKNETFDPEQDVIPLRFEYAGNRIFGYAKGSLDGKTSTFHVFSGIGNFILLAQERSPAHYRWTSSSAYFPRQEIIRMIGKRIEQFFRGLSTPGAFDNY